MTASTDQSTEARYSVYTPDGKTWKVWDASAERFVQNPVYDFPTTDFDFRADAARIRDELNAAAETPAETERGDDEPTATAPATAPVMLGHLRPQPRRRSGKVGSTMSVARRLANLAKIAARVNAGQHTAAGYLAAELHTDAAFVKCYSSPFGKAAAKVYREQYGADPAKTGLDVRGHRLVRVFAYTAGVLEKAAVNYPRTQPLLIGA